MAGEEETEGDAPSERSSGSGRAGREPERVEKLPPRVLRALAQAREAARADRQRKGGRILVLVPIGVAVLVLLLMMPRSAEPSAIPLPRVDRRVLRSIARADDARAAAAERTRLPGDVLAVGTALRAIHAAEDHDADAADIAAAQRQLEAAIGDLPRRERVEEDLLALRALQTRRFLDVLAAWEATGERSQEHVEIAGNFVRRSEEAGWVAPGRRLLLTEDQRRVAFKSVWNALARVDGRAAFALALDEQRALYALYLERPHPPDSYRAALLAQRRDARTPEACARAALEERRQRELWRADKVRKLGVIDPSYPVQYALGVAWYRAGRYDLSAEAFTTFVAAHPDGPYALRARNHLKAALTAHEAL